MFGRGGTEPGAGVPDAEVGRGGGKGMPAPPGGAAIVSER